MDRYDEKVRKLEAEYREAHPKAENPFNWHEQFYVGDIFDKVKKADGRLVLVKEDPDALDGGQLIYG